MSERRRKYTAEFKTEAAKVVVESGRPIAEVAREIHEAYAKPGYEFCDHVIDLRGRQFLIMPSRGFA